jgi:hypothetical protein
MGCGAAVVAVMPYMWPFLSPYRYAFYRSSQPLDNILWALLLDFLVVSVVAASFFFYLQRRGTIDRSLVWVLVAARLAAGLAQLHANSEKQTMRHVSMEISFGLTLLAGIGLWFLSPRTYREVAKGLAVVLVLVGLSATWIVPELMYLAVHQRAPDAVLARTTSAPNKIGRRVIWVVFDELSYKQAFEHRFPGLAMPAFDHLKSQSFLFENLQPAARYTDIALPTLFLGKTVEDIKSDANGRAILKLAGQKQWSQLDPHATIFATAQRDGWTTGVAGWWNPYCRILPDTLDACYWSTEETNGIFSTEKSVLANAAAPLLTKAGWSSSPPVEEKHQASLVVLMQQANALIADERIKFVFIHLPVPHAPGIFDRKTGSLRNGGTYIDNLALADRSLGELEQSLDRTASASQTTLVVCSDHSWRTAMWKLDANWSQEEEAASQGQFDPRPLLMIRYPQQSNPVAISQPFRHILLHSILVGMLDGRLATAGQLQQWLSLPAS